jgi:hypothetical protein
MEGLVDAFGVAGCVEVHEQAADDGEHDGGQLGPAEAAHAFLEWLEPVGGCGTPETRPEWFACSVVQATEHAQIGLTLRSSHRGPCVVQSRRVGNFRSEAQEADEGIELAPPGLSKYLAEQAVTGSEVVDQHPARGAGGGGQGTEPIGKPVLERVVGARIEQSLPDLWLALPSHSPSFSRNEWYVYCCFDS